MKVIAFNGSARRDGNTAILIEAVFDGLRKEGIETEMVQLAGRPRRSAGEVRADEEGMRTMKGLGENMAWLLKKGGS